DVNGVATCRAGRKICNDRGSRPAFDEDEIVATAEEETAGKGAAFAEHERIRAVTELHVAHDAAVIEDRLVTVTPADGNVHALDQPQINDQRQQLSMVHTNATNDVKFYPRRAGMIACVCAGALFLNRDIAPQNEHARRSNRAKQIARGGPAIGRNLS